MRIRLSKAFISGIMFLMLHNPTITHGTLSLKPVYTGRLEISTKKNYSFNTSLITAQQKIHGFALLMFYRATHKKKNLDQAIKSINEKFKEFELWLLTEEYKALIALKNKCNMSNEIWDNCLKDIDQLKNIYRQALKESKPHTIHDVNTPYNLLNTFTTLLTKNSINPQSVSITTMNAPCELTVMQLKTYVGYSIDSTNNSLIIKKEYTPITIEIFPRMYDLINQEKTVTALCAHEIEHIIQCHFLTKTIINIYLNHYYSIDDETLMNLPEFQQLTQIHEAQAELFSALHDPEIALCLCSYRKNECYPHYLYEGHFHNLSTIATLWQLEKSLTWLHGLNLINKTTSLLKNTLFS